MVETGIKEEEGPHNRDKMRGSAIYMKLLTTLETMFVAKRRIIDRTRVAAIRPSKRNFSEKT